MSLILPASAAAPWRRPGPPPGDVLPGGAYNVHQNSYHTRAVDSDLPSVAAGLPGPLPGSGRPGMQGPDQSGKGTVPEHLSVAKIS